MLLPTYVGPLMKKGGEVHVTLERIKSPTEGDSGDLSSSESLFLILTRRLWG